MTLIAIVLSAAAPNVSACPVPATWATEMPPVAGLEPPTNIVSFKGERLSWNGVPITEAQLELYLRVTTTMSPMPRLVVDTDPMPCATLARVFAAVERAAVPCSKKICIATPYRRLFAPPAPPAPPAPMRRR